jgi:DNA-binding NarL/FixJ family response regulator
MAGQSPETGHDSDGPISPRGRVIVADDDVLLREGVASLLTSVGFEIVGQAGDGARLLELVQEHVPDLAIIDVRMPPTGTTEGLQAASEIRSRFPSVAILVLSAYVEVEHALELLSSGNRIGYLLKTRVTDVAELIDALDRIAKGGSVIDPFLVQRLFAAHGRSDPLAKLSAREREVLALMAEGASGPQIADTLIIALPTVKTHQARLYEKLGVSDRAAAVAEAMRRGLLE